MGKRWSNFIANFAPDYALKIDIARARIERMRGENKNFIDRFLDGGNITRSTFGAVSGDRLRYDFLTSALSPDSAVEDDGEKLRNNIRSLEYNNGRVAGPIRRITENVVGRGIKFQSSVSADDNDYLFPKITEAQATEFNFMVEKAWKEWARLSDAKLNQTFFEQQAIIEGALVRDGAILSVFRNSNRRDRLVMGRQIPICIELLEIDRLKTPIEESQNPQIRGGIEYDDEGVKQSYWIMKRHPGDKYMQPGMKIPYNLPSKENMEKIPAFDSDGTPKVLHLYHPSRPEQTKGYSQLAPGLKDLQDLERYMEAEKLAALENACLTGIVKTNQPSTFATNYTKTSGSGEYSNIHEFAPGKWHYLRPGEEASILYPNRPNQAFGTYIKELASGPANGMNIPPEIANQDWHGMNYSNARTVLLQFYLTCRIRQQYLVDHFNYWTHIKLLKQLIYKGVVKAPGYDLRKSDYEAHYWVSPGWAWVDPKKEVEGLATELDNNLTTIADIAASKGKDIDELLESRARELKKMKLLEEKYDIKFASKQSSAPTDTDGDEDTDEEDTNESGARTLLQVV